MKSRISGAVSSVSPLLLLPQPVGNKKSNDDREDDDFNKRKEKKSIRFNPSPMLMSRRTNVSDFEKAFEDTKKDLRDGCALSKDSFTSEAFSLSLVRKPARFSEEKGDAGGCQTLAGVAVSSSSSSSPAPLVSRGG